MRILIIDNSSFATNGGRYFTNALNGIFIDEMIRLGNEVVYFQFCSSSSNNLCSFDLEEHGVTCIPLPYTKHKFLSYLHAFLKAVKQIKASNFVYLYYPNSFRYCAFLCLLLNRPYGLYIRGMNGLNTMLSYFFYKNAQTILTVSESFSLMVNRAIGEKVAHTIKPMIPFSDADVIIGREYFSKDCYRILYLGRLAADKGLAELVKAAKHLHDNGFSFKLTIVGNGEFSSCLSQKVMDMHLQDVITLEGPVFDNDVKANYYKQADLYVLPTYHEGFPRTLYEAMIFGTPIITTLVGGIPALMEDGVNCKRIEPRSVDSIVETLTFAMNNYEYMGRMAKNATQLVAKVVDHNRPTHAQDLYFRIKQFDK